MSANMSSRMDKVWGDADRCFSLFAEFSSQQTKEGWRRPDLANVVVQPGNLHGYVSGTILYQRNADMNSRDRQAIHPNVEPECGGRYDTMLENQVVRYRGAASNIDPRFHPMRAARRRTCASKCRRPAAPVTMRRPTPHTGTPATALRHCAESRHAPICGTLPLTTSSPGSPFE